jgi:flagellar motility protein MotE (MotC chaperone)
MIDKLQNPAVAAALGITLSVGLGASMAVRVLTPLMEKAVVKKEKVLPAELKEKGWDFWTIEIDNLSNELKEERARLKKQAEQVDQRAARVSAEEKELAKLRADVEALRKEIGEKIVEIKTDEAKNLRTLSQTYTTLTPKGAVAILREMDDATAVKILSLMKTDIVGPIFEEMGKTLAPDGTPLARRAALLSEKIRLMKATKQTPPPT